MNIKKVLTVVAAAANAVSIASWLILTAAGSSLARSCGGDRAADRWAPDGGYTQVSCFFSEDADFNTDVLGGVKNELLNGLKSISIVPEDGRELIPEAYSTDAGQVTMRGDPSGRAEAKLTAVGGSFFLFRDFKLLNGAYFTDSDIMQDGVVIDRRLAWQLYGSTNVSGMNIYLDGIKFYISGVIDDPSTKHEKRTAGDDPRAYITYEGLKLLNGIGPDNSDMMMDDPTKKISCYECIVPDPVENYAYNAVNDYFSGTYQENCLVVNNTERFEPSVRAKAHKALSDSVIWDRPVVLPYWENASRIVEFRLSGIYYYRRLTYIIPVLTALVLLVLIMRAGKKLRIRIVDKIKDIITRILYAHEQKKIRKREEKESNNSTTQKENLP